MMKPGAWMKEFVGAVTVCDADGIILEMNDRSVKMFEQEGGAALIGTSLLACHPEPSRATLVEIMRTRRVNAYTSEKNGRWKLVYQSPWQKNGEYAGFVEIVLEIPSVLPHFVRG